MRHWVALLGLGLSIGVFLLFVVLGNVPLMIVTTVLVVVWYRIEKRCREHPRR